jgi:hypothetical protein
MYLFYVIQIAIRFPLTHSGGSPLATTKKSTVLAHKPKTSLSKKKADKTVSGSHSRPVEKRIVTIDRRKADRRQKNLPVEVERRALQRRVKVNRRRQIDPTTCERDYTQDEIEFMNAMDEYKRISGRMFPTCSEVLEVIRKLGYEKPPVHDPEKNPPPRPPLAENPLFLTAETVTIY